MHTLTHTHTHTHPHTNTHRQLKVLSQKISGENDLPLSHFLCFLPPALESEISSTYLGVKKRDYLLTNWTVCVNFGDCGQVFTALD